ncbi:EF-hand calcium-binding domain-containing protein 1 [Intoshia linei]|uniref:non-specific serine/threonine protein kinase n=1 Tax=Intoshia linei TaxID=1819745 RepID=A0A177B5A6_9BILA|nr:EF-hand calcium-binding domain-containing protein 1 [Intoshia linei]
MAQIYERKRFHELAQALSKKCHFNKPEIEKLLVLFSKLSDGKNKMDRVTFFEFLYKNFDIMDDMIAGRVFRIFSFRSNDGRLSEEEWIMGLSTFLRATLEEKCKFIFQIYDVNADNLITRDDIFHFVKNSILKQTSDEEPEESVKDLIDRVIILLDHNKDGVISYEDYETSVKNDYIVAEILGSCTPDVEAQTQKFEIYKMDSNYDITVKTKIKRNRKLRQHNRFKNRKVELEKQRNIKEWYNFTDCENFSLNISEYSGNISDKMDINTNNQYQFDNYNKSNQNALTSTPAQNGFRKLNIRLSEIDEDACILNLSHVIKTNIENQNSCNLNITVGTVKILDYYKKMPLPLPNNSHFEKFILDLFRQEKFDTFTKVFQSWQNFFKLGEGSFGEVYNVMHNNKNIAVKIIPTNGHVEIQARNQSNEENQKSVFEMLPEIICSKILSLISIKNNSNFVVLERMSVTKGKYTKNMIEAYKTYDTKNESNYDDPNSYKKKQIFFVLSYQNCGIPIEFFDFKDYIKVNNIFKQIVLTLAIGEVEIQFEHRDLHLGNILFEIEEPRVINYKVGSTFYPVDNNGVKITVIDFSLSRMTVNDLVFFNDLTTDEDLFAGPQHDKQFQAYREMKKHIKNDNWKEFTPYTNIIWLNYILSSFIEYISTYNQTLRIQSKKYTKEIKEINTILRHLRHLKLTILKFESAHNFLSHPFFKSDL